MSSRFTKLDSK